MRLKLTFALNRFPLSNRLGILSIIKQCISNSSDVYFKEFFIRRKREIKPFVFSTYFQNLLIDNEEIHASQLQVTVSSNDYEFLLHLYNGAKCQKHYSYQGYSLELIRFQLLHPQTVQSNEVQFRFLSPLLLENKEGKPVRPESAEFEQELNYISNLAVQTYLGHPLRQPLKILGKNLKKQVIKEYFHQPHSHPLYFTAYKGILQLSGHQEDLQCLYDCGLGMRSNLGFGLVNIE